MKAVYPVIFTRLDDGYMAFVPDFQINTQGNDLAEAISMARDAIGLSGIDMEDDGKALPTPSGTESILCKANELVSMVDIDFTAYRRANGRRTVRKNVTLPSWLNAEAEQAGVNFSLVLQEGLKAKLGLS
ncbi:MAG: type II toxin-antitoxin system HicB family antitoxin [Clostridia bacterium]